MSVYAMVGITRSKVIFYTYEYIYIYIYICIYIYIYVYIICIYIYIYIDPVEKMIENKPLVGALVLHLWPKAKFCSGPATMIFVQGCLEAASLK